MALLEDVYELFDTLDVGVQQLNGSTTLSEYQQHATTLLSRLDTSVDWGNSQELIDALIEQVSLIRFADDPVTQEIGVEAFNDLTEKLSEYFETHWWQFGASEKRDPIDTVPTVSYLERFDWWI